MSNPYLTMYGYDNSGDTLEHAWLNKSKEKAYNHQYYLMNRNRLLAQKKKLRDPANNAYYDRARSRLDNTEARVNARQQELRNEAAGRLAEASGRMSKTGAKILYDPLNVNKHQREFLGAGKDMVDATGRLVKLNESQARTNANIQRRRNNIDINQGQAENAYQAEIARRNRAIRANAQAEARAKMAENNSFPNRLKQEARKLSYKVGAPIARATSKLRDKAKDIMGKAKAALEKAKLKVRAMRGSGAGVSDVARKAMDRAKELYEKAKGRVKEIYNKITKKK